MKILTIKLKILMGLLSLCFAVGAQASLSEFQTFTGNVGLSTDGFGSISEAGVISASVPAGSTVIAAFLYSATNNTNATPTITLDGSAVALGPRVANATACCSLASFRADVTSIVKPIIDAGPGGVYNFNITEGGALISQIDGEVLIVVYENASLGISTIGILDGFASVSGDVATISYAEALDPSEAGFFAEMRLGISFSCCSQKSQVLVNGSLLTNNAGNFDDGGSLADGSLITMGGFDDPFSGVNPSYADDHERYDLVPFISAGDTSITINTNNASEDDNIFVVTFFTSGLASVCDSGDCEPPPSDDDPTPVPEPSSLALLGLGLLGLRFSRRVRK